MKPLRVALLTAGGLAPCLSAAVGELIRQYSEVSGDIEILCYRSGYKGLLRGDSFLVTPDMRAQAGVLRRYGGSPIGNSRVRLTNVDDCVKRGLVKPGQDPREVAARQLRKDGVDVLHTIGGDDTNIAAADLAAWLKGHGYALRVIGLPKTIDNDIIPVRQSLGAWTAAEQGARFFENIVSEQGASSRMLIIHEVMGRHCGWLTAATTRHYLRELDGRHFAPSLGISPERWAVHGVYIPEMQVDFAAEADRLRGIMDRQGNVNLFVSEGACIDTILAEMAARGIEPERDPFGHVKLDKINVGQWFADHLGKAIGAEKVLVQKSGYFARSAPANDADFSLIERCAEHAIEAALRGESGVVGEDTEHENRLRTIELDRIKGGRIFDTRERWFREMLVRTGQSAGRPRHA